MSTFPTDVLSVIVKALQPKCFTKFRATSKEYRRHISDRFQYYQSQRIQEFKEHNYVLLDDCVTTMGVIHSQAKRLEEQHIEYKKLYTKTQLVITQLNLLRTTYKMRTIANNTQ